MLWYSFVISSILSSSGFLLTGPPTWSCGPPANRAGGGMWGRYLICPFHSLKAKDTGVCVIAVHCATDVPDVEKGDTSSFVRKFIPMIM